MNIIGDQYEFSFENKNEAPYAYLKKKSRAELEEMKKEAKEARHAFARQSDQDGVAYKTELIEAIEDALLDAA